MRVCLLIIGDEILIGQITDTNSGLLGGLLTQNGFEVGAKLTVGDQPDAILHGLEYAMGLADVVITSGGLGPTKDDVTKKTIASFFGSELVFHQETFDRIEAYFKKIGRKLPEAMREQAMLPEHAVLLPNDVGSAPGMWFESNDQKMVVSLPGVPWELEHLMTEQVLPRLLRRFPGSPIAHKTLLTAGEGESNIARRIEGFEAALPEHIKLAYLPSLGQVRLRLSGKLNGVRTADKVQQLEEELESKVSALHESISDLVFGREKQTLQEVLGQLLLDQGKKITTAESCTGGYVASMITSTPGSSAYYPGSIVSYSYEMKTKLLGVKAETLLKYGAVSEETVREMVKGVLPLMEADVAIAISGIAGPGGGTPDKPVGTVWMAVGDRDQIVTRKFVFGRDREKNIAMTAVYALNLARKFLLKELNV